MTRTLDGISHVIWDWNGTLLDDAWLCIEVMNGLLGRRGMTLLDAERYQRVFAFPVREYYRRLGFDFAAEPFEQVGTEFIEGYQARQHECRLQSGAREALAELSGRSLTQSVLSASQRSRLVAQAEALEVRASFVRMIGLEDHYAGGKLEQGRGWIAELGLAPRSVLLVGDTDHDAEVAREMGVRCLLVPSGHQSTEKLRASGATVLTSLARLFD
jgi:phosphoglycolate phosphatase